MSAPTAEHQIKFLTNLQRLLAEGQFVATYKYALLLALADIAIETGDDGGEPLTVSTKLIAEKFIQYYWRQVVPYVPKADPTAGQVLRQNTGRQAAIIRQVLEARQQYGDSLLMAQRDRSAWKALVRDVDQVVRQMPLWKLQTLRKDDHLHFLYDNLGQGSEIVLKPGVAFCLRTFHGLVTELVRASWLRFVRRQNAGAVGDAADLAAFLFGSERADLSKPGKMPRWHGKMPRQS